MHIESRTYRRVTQSKIEKVLLEQLRTQVLFTLYSYTHNTEDWLQKE